MLFDRLGDARLLALRGRVIAAHESLQLRELADHFGRKVGLGEMSRARSKFGVGADLRRKLARQRLDARDPLALRAELLVKDDAVEFLEALVERLRALVLGVRQGREIGLPEVARVGEAGAHDAAVAGRDRRAVIGGDEVRDKDELVGEPAGGLSRVMAGLEPAIHAVPSCGRVRFRALRRPVDGRLKAGHDGGRVGRRWRLPQHEAFLIGADGGADDFGRQVEERRLELAHQHDRPFDQARDFLKQAFVLDERQPLSEGEVFGVGEDDRLAPVGVEHDLRFLQRVDVIVEAADMNWLRRHEAVAPGHVAGRNPVDLERDDFRRLVLGRERANDATQRAHPAQCVLSQRPVECLT